MSFDDVSGKFLLHGGSVESGTAPFLALLFSPGANEILPTGREVEREAEEMSERKRTPTHTHLLHRG